MTIKNSGLFKGENVRRILRSLVILAVILPLLRPLGIPIEVNQQERQYYEIVESLEPGDTVVVEWDLSADKYEGAAFGAAVTIKRFWQKGIRFVFYTFSETGISTLGKFLSEPLLLPLPPDIEYGKDYVIVGFIPGTETGLASVAQNLWQTGKDYFGNDLSNLPLTKEITKFEDFKMIFCFQSSGPLSLSLFRQWVSPYGTPLVGVYPGAEATGMFSWYPDWIQAIVSDTMGSAMLEQLFKIPYKATSISDASSLVVVMLLTIIIAANVSHWTSRGKEAV